MEENKETLNEFIKNKLDELNKMANDFTKIERFGHYNSLLEAALPGGLLGTIRENIQEKKFDKYLKTPIYKGLGFAEIGISLVDYAKELCEAQKIIQGIVSKSDSCYYGNVEAIIETVNRCQKEWVNIAPKVANEAIEDSDGSTFSMGPQVEYEINLEYVKMDLPEKYNSIKKTVNQAGKGCMVPIMMIIGSSLLAAFLI